MLLKLMAPQVPWLIFKKSTWFFMRRCFGFGEVSGA